MKKICAIICSVVMMLTLCIPANAFDPKSDTWTSEDIDGILLPDGVVPRIAQFMFAMSITNVRQVVVTAEPKTFTYADINHGGISITGTLTATGPTSYAKVGACVYSAISDEYISQVEDWEFPVGRFGATFLNVSEFEACEGINPGATYYGFVTNIGGYPLSGDLSFYDGLW